MSFHIEDVNIPPISGDSGQHAKTCYPLSQESILACCCHHVFEGHCIYLSGGPVDSGKKVHVTAW
jgi:hypothetical protein